MGINPIDLALEILSEDLAVPVFTDVPKDRPPTCVAVDLEGDSSTEFVLRPTIALTCWDTTDRGAHGLATSAVDALRNASLDHPYLSSCQLETMSREEWSRNGQNRYLAVVELTINTDE